MNKIKVIVLVAWALLVFALVVHGAAPTMFFVDGSTSFERGRIERLERSLNFTREPMPDTWDIHIIPEEQFNANVRRMHLDTVSAYTFVGLDQTYINEAYLVYASDQSARHTVAHEAAHLILAGGSEEKANAVARQLEFGK